MTTIRAAKKEDLNHFKIIIQNVELFPAELLDEMVRDFFNNPSSNDIWLTATIEDKPIGLCYCAPERMTEGTYNMYLIAVHKNFQSQGNGELIVDYLEKLLIEKGARILIAETSGLDEFAGARAFYKRCNYTQEAVIHDFYTEGDDKIVFWKKLI